MGANKKIQSVSELWLQLYSPLRKIGCNFTVCYRNMGKIVQSVTEIWLKEYSLLRNYLCKYTVCYGIMGASL